MEAQRMETTWLNRRIRRTNEPVHIGNLAISHTDTDIHSTRISSKGGMFIRIMFIGQTRASLANKTNNSRIEPDRPNVVRSGTGESVSIRTPLSIVIRIQAPEARQTRHLKKNGRLPDASNDISIGCYQNKCMFNHPDQGWMTQKRALQLWPRPLSEPQGSPPRSETCKIRLPGNRPLTRKRHTSLTLPTKNEWVGMLSYWPFDSKQVWTAQISTQNFMEDVAEITVLVNLENGRRLCGITWNSKTSKDDRHFRITGLGRKTLKCIGKLLKKEK